MQTQLWNTGLWWSRLKAQSQWLIVFPLIASFSQDCNEHRPASVWISIRIRLAMADLKSKFLNVYSVLKSELLEDPAFEFTDVSRQWVERVQYINLHWIPVLASMHVSFFQSYPSGICLCLLLKQIILHISFVHQHVNLFKKMQILTLRFKTFEF